MLFVHFSHFLTVSLPHFSYIIELFRKKPAHRHTRFRFFKIVLSLPNAKSPESESKEFTDKNAKEYDWNSLALHLSFTVPHNIFID